MGRGWHLTASSEGSGRAYTGGAGDPYELTITIPQKGEGDVITHTQKTSTGTIQKRVGQMLTLKPSNAEETFIVSLDSSEKALEGLEGTVTFNDGSTLPKVEALSPIAPLGGNYPFCGAWHGYNSIINHGEERVRNYCTIVISENLFWQITWPFEENGDGDIQKMEFIIRDNTKVRTISYVHYGDNYQWVPDPGFDLETHGKERELSEFFQVNNDGTELFIPGFEYYEWPLRRRTSF